MEHDVVRSDVAAIADRIGAAAAVAAVDVDPLVVPRFEVWSQVLHRLKQAKATKEAFGPAIARNTVSRRSQ